MGKDWLEKAENFEKDLLHGNKMVYISLGCKFDQIVLDHDTKEINTFLTERAHRGIDGYVTLKSLIRRSIIKIKSEKYDEEFIEILTDWLITRRNFLSQKWGSSPARISSKYKRSNYSLDCELGGSMLGTTLAFAAAGRMTQQSNINQTGRIYAKIIAEAHGSDGRILKRSEAISNGRIWFLDRENTMVYPDGWNPAFHPFDDIIVFRHVRSNKPVIVLYAHKLLKGDSKDLDRDVYNILKVLEAETKNPNWLDKCTKELHSKTQ